MNWQETDIYKNKVKELTEIVGWFAGKESLAITGTVGLGKTTFLKSLPYEIHKERNANVTLNKGIVELKQQKELIKENLKELMDTKNIYDRHALVDGYVFYCVSGEYLIDTYREQGNLEDARFVADDMKEFKQWYWQWITDFVVHIDFKFNILFLLQGNTTEEELLNRIIGRNRQRDDIELMKRFVNRFEEFALRTLKEIRALGANINITEYEINDNNTPGRLLLGDAGPKNAKAEIEDIIINEWMKDIYKGDFLKLYADKLAYFRTMKSLAISDKRYDYRDLTMTREWQFKRWFWDFMEKIVPDYTNILFLSMTQREVNENFDLMYVVRAFQDNVLKILLPTDETTE